MEQPTTVRLPQDRETPATEVRLERFACRYAYARSADSRIHGDPGQDYLVLRYTEERLAFVLCDGVSQSFYGDLAAQLLGEALLEWLWSDLPRDADPPRIENELVRLLHGLTERASERVRAFRLPSGLPPLHRDVVERARAEGSESIFVGGSIDTAAGRVTLVWMGDSRIRLWGPDGERTAVLGDSFHTRERWSSRRGPVGHPHAAIVPLADLHSVTAYSDGLARLDGSATPPDHNRALDSLIRDAIAAPTSDDVSYLEVRLAPLPLAEVPERIVPAPAQLLAVLHRGGLVVSWQPVPGATHYEVELSDGGVRRWRSLRPEWRASIADSQLREGGALRVRAWSLDDPGAWSSPMRLPRPAGTGIHQGNGRPSPLLLATAMLLFGMVLGGVLVGILGAWGQDGPGLAPLATATASALVTPTALPPTATPSQPPALTATAPTTVVTPPSTALPTAPTTPTARSTDPAATP